VNDRARESGGAQGAAVRVARNTAVRGTADLVGKVFSLVLIVVLARQEGPLGVGILIFALAWGEIAAVPIDMGLDRYFLRHVARDRRELDSRFFNVLTLKLVRAVPVIAVSWLLILVVSDDAETRVCVFLLTASFFLDGLSLTVYAAFNALERAELIAASLITQRLMSAGVGVLLLLTGSGVVAVAVAYAVASALAFVVAMALLAGRIGMPARRLPRGPRRDLWRRSLPFAAQELMSTGVARIDALLLAALASQTVVGLYGSAYRLLEATLFVSVALQGAFVAMFTYLDERSEPSIHAVVQRAIKLSLTLLVPCAVVLLVLAEQILEMLFGSRFDAATTPLRLLALTVVPLGLSILMWTLITSRREPRVLILYSALVLTLNIALNVALIPPFGAEGAAAAMLGTYVIGALFMLRVSIQTVGSLQFRQTAGGPLAAGAAMALVALALQPWVVAALPACVVAYFGVLAAIERKLAPDDLGFMLGMLRRLVRSPRADSLQAEQSERL
jgi:O-antigen/teichoic acid export membrane protein